MHIGACMPPMQVCTAAWVACITVQWASKLQSPHGALQEVPGLVLS